MLLGFGLPFLNSQTPHKCGLNGEGECRLIDALEQGVLILLNNVVYRCDLEYLDLIPTYDTSISKGIGSYRPEN